MSSEKPVLMAVVAHPDDAELRCFGTLCRYRDSGYKCHVIIMCSGENGISLNDRVVMNETHMLKQERLQETIKAFEGSNINVEILDADDAYTQFSRDLIIKIEKKLRINRPKIVITHYVDSYGVDHQDHHYVGMATINSATRMDCVEKILLCEPLMTLRSGFIPNYYVDITKYFDSKVQALAKHKSQKGRFYLEREYHQIKTDYYAINVGYLRAQEHRKYEAFQLLFAVR